MTEQPFGDRTYSVLVDIDVHPNFRILVDDDEPWFQAYLITDVVGCVDLSDADLISQHGEAVSNLGYDTETKEYISLEGDYYSTVQAWVDHLPKEFLTTAFTDLTSQTRERLQSLMERSKGVRPVITHTIQFTVRQAARSPRNLIKAVERVTKKQKKNRNKPAKKPPYIYCFSVSRGAALEKIRARFSEAKDWFQRRDYSRLNEGLSSCLYVGSSYELPNRFKEHLGYGTPAKFALQLVHWARDFHELELTFEYAEYDDTLEEDVLQALEDTLWEKRKPMFGRKGSK